MAKKEYSPLKPKYALWRIGSLMKQYRKTKEKLKEQVAFEHYGKTKENFDRKEGRQ
jgi:hypothetical protein